MRTHSLHTVQLGIHTALIVRRRDFEQQKLVISRCSFLGAEGEGEASVELEVAQWAYSDG